MSGIAGKDTQVKPMRRLARGAGCKYSTLIQIMTLCGPDSVPYKYMQFQCTVDNKYRIVLRMRSSNYGRFYVHHACRNYF